MTCRAPSSATTCSGTVTGQQMTYDAERRVSHWQSSPSAPTSTADYLYDGSGSRIEQVDTSSGSTTKVYYLFGGLEEIDASGPTSTLTKYYAVGGLQIGVNVGGTISYLVSDGLGSVSEALSTSGTVTAAQLYGPYGGVRYSSGTMPTAKGFTGQYGDAISGLDYYGARYYDPLLGQFISADTKQGPNRFAYVADDPETLTDPTGHLPTSMDPHDGGIYDWQRYPANGRPLGTNVDFAPGISPNCHDGENCKTLITAAQKVIRAQNSAGGPGVLRDPKTKKVIKKTPTYGSYVVNVNNAGVGFKNYSPQGVIVGTDAFHAEAVEIDQAVKAIQQYRAAYGFRGSYGAEYVVNLITTLPPCQGKCQPQFLDEEKGWMHSLMQAAGIGMSAIVNLRVWVIEPDPADPERNSQLTFWGGAIGTTGINPSDAWSYYFPDVPPPPGIS